MTGTEPPRPAAADAAPDAAHGTVLHATAVAVAGKGLLILGPSGAGKSSLALRMIALGAVLVADDATLITAGPDSPLLSCPPPIAGRIEARGLGLLRLPPAGPTPARAALNLLRTPGPRLPEPATIRLAGHAVPLFRAVDAAHLAAAMMLALRHDCLPDDVHP